MNLAKEFMKSKRNNYWKDISNYLKKFTKQNQELIEADYQVDSRKYMEDYWGPTIADAQYVLQFRKGAHIYNEELAIAGFNIEDNELIIKQLQASKDLYFYDRHVFLNKLKWERMLTSMVEDWAFLHGAPTVSIRPAERNPYWKNLERVHTGMTIEKHRGNLKMRYDVTSKRSGYKYDDKKKLWVKENPKLKVH